MKTKLLFTALLVIFCLSTKAQTSPPSETSNDRLSETKIISSLSDTLTFTPFINETILETQYLNKGVVFSGFNGSTAPVVCDYGLGSYGKVLRSDNWYNPLRMNFVDSLNANQYQLASKIEFDNPVSDDGELDYMSIDVYDSMNVLIYHYLSTSPEHVVLNFATPSAAYITIDDSAYTAFILDNIVVEFGNITSTNKNISNDFRLYPNPFSSQTTLQTDNILRNATLTVVNCYGQEIKKMGNISGQTVTMFRDNLPSGLHFIHLTENNKILAVAKLVIVDN
jgi:hypothetical protein